MQTAAPAKVAAERADDERPGPAYDFLPCLSRCDLRLDHPDAPVPPRSTRLVPAYLKVVPSDPFGKGPLKLKVQDDTAWVYSVGPEARTMTAAPHLVGQLGRG